MIVKVSLAQFNNIVLIYTPVRFKLAGAINKGVKMAFSATQRAT